MFNSGSPVVSLINNEPRTNSTDVAAYFGKQHKDVLRQIRNIMANCPESFNERNFALVETKDAKGEMRPRYSLTRDAFMLVVMGFTGHKAMQCKLAYIEEFNRMEAELAGRSLPTPEPKPEPLPESSAPVPAFNCPYVPKNLPPQISTPIISKEERDELTQLADQALMDIGRAGFSCQAFFSKLTAFFYNSRHEQLPPWAIELVNALDATKVYQRDNANYLRLSEQVRQGMRAVILLHSLQPGQAA